MDVTGAASAAIQTVVQGAQAASAAPNPPSTETVARFENAMGSPSGGPPGQFAALPTGSQPSSEASSASPLAPAEAAVSPGDAILRGLERMSQAHTDTMAHVQGQLSSVQPGEMMSTSSMFEMQIAISQLSLQQDIVGKVAGKATQNLDSFLKNQ